MDGDSADPVELLKWYLLNFLSEFHVCPGQQPEPQLVQLHWQNRDNFRETEFIAQGGFTSFDEFDVWARELFERRHAECPEGWVPMVCTQDSEYFVLSPEE